MRHNVHDAAGNSIQGALLAVFQTGTVTPVTDMFAAATGGSPITTITSDAQGDAVAWFDTAQTVDITVSDNGGTAFYPSRPAELLSWSDFTETMQVGDVAGGGGAHPDLATHDAMGLATDAALSATATALQAHLDDASEAHHASTVGFTPTGGVASTNVQDAMVEVATEAGSSAIEVIARVVVGVGGAATIDFTSIPQTYENLRLVGTLRCDFAADERTLRLRANNDSGANYHGKGTDIGGSVGLFQEYAQTTSYLGRVAAANSGAARPTILVAEFAAYARTTLQKQWTSVAHYFGASDMFTSKVGHWMSTAAINRLTIFPASGNFIEGSVLTLYGVKGS